MPSAHFMMHLIPFFSNPPLLSVPPQMKKKKKKIHNNDGPRGSSCRKACKIGGKKIKNYNIQEDFISFLLN